MVARQALGMGVLRAECACSIATADYAVAADDSSGASGHELASFCLCHNVFNVPVTKWVLKRKPDRRGEPPCLMQSISAWRTLEKRR